MTLTLKPMKKRVIDYLALKQLLVFLTGLSLSACSGLKPFPADHIIEYDNKNKVCGYYQITDPEHLKVEYVKDVPCPAVFGFESKDIANILNWGQDAQDYVRSHCQ